MDSDGRQEAVGRSRRQQHLPLCLLLLLLTLASNAQAQTGSWIRQQTGTLAWLHSLFFLDQHRGWAVGSKGVLLATTDGGATWKIKARPSEDILRDIYFSDD